MSNFVGSTSRETALKRIRNKNYSKRVPASGFAVTPNAVTNGGMEGTYDVESDGGGGTVNVAPGWNRVNVETDGTDTLDKETTIVHSGSASQYISVDKGNEGIDSAANVFTSGKWHRVTLWVYATAGDIQVQDNSNEFIDKTITSPSASWSRYTWIVYATSARRLFIRSDGGAATFYVDDVSIVVLD